MLRIIIIILMPLIGIQHHLYCAYHTLPIPLAVRWEKNPKAIISMSISRVIASAIVHGPKTAEFQEHTQKMLTAFDPHAPSLRLTTRQEETLITKVDIHSFAPDLYQLCTREDLGNIISLDVRPLYEHIQKFIQDESNTLSRVSTAHLVYAISQSIEKLHGGIKSGRIILNDEGTEIEDVSYECFNGTIFAKPLSIIHCDETFRYGNILYFDPACFSSLTCKIMSRKIKFLEFLASQGSTCAGLYT